MLAVAVAVQDTWKVPTVDVRTGPHPWDWMPEGSWALGVAVAVPLSRTGLGVMVGASVGPVVSPHGRKMAGLPVMLPACPPHSTVMVPLLMMTPSLPVSGDSVAPPDLTVIVPLFVRVNSVVKCPKVMSTVPEFVLFRASPVERAGDRAAAAPR